MHYLPISQLPIVEEQEAMEEIAEIYNSIQREMEVPFTPNVFKALASSPPTLIGTWELLRNVYLQSNLPMSLKAMILFSIATTHQCQYCSAVHQVTCKTIGIDEETLEVLASDLDRMRPRRIQEIIRFAIKCADNAGNLTEEDYNGVREQGISNEELMEVIALAAVGTYMDTLADAMKIEIDSVFAQSL